ncbi:Conserved_hypothetical protein [Hexamita inflata]|uniref:Uncharacterized protein n=1 Tax=Hexamita inflata TaxID=28002 RepID=A0AA86Q039_9EUKA|nr:Conserved hypothetical protein [Hexamita inflata]
MLVLIYILNSQQNHQNDGDIAQSGTQVQKLSAVKICGQYAMPDPNNLASACICQGSSLVLQTDLVSCACPASMYYNSLEKSCLSCPSGTPDISQSFCYSANTKYFNLATKLYTNCYSNSLSSPTQNYCMCTASAYLKGSMCTACPGARSNDLLTCLCPDGSRFDESSGTCLACLITGQVFNDRSVCTCEIGTVNIGNSSCQVCAHGSVDRNPGVVNMEGCMCEDKRYYWSNTINRCVRCAFGNTEAGNSCACPVQISMINLANNNCTCFGNTYFDGHFCVEKLVNEMKVCGSYAKPDPNNAMACICDDSSLVLQADAINCKCKTGFYYNSASKTCLTCTTGTPDLLQTFCVCPSISNYFDMVSQTCKACPSGGRTSASSNACICFVPGNYLKPIIDKEATCAPCFGGQLMRTTDKLTCKCTSPKRFDEYANECISCNAIFTSSLLYNDRSICMCPEIGQVNINNASCQQCVSGSVDNNPGQLNADGCQCINKNYFWSNQNNTCTECPYGISNFSNQCVCPVQSVVNSLNNSCICFGFFYFDGHSCVKCPLNSILSNNVCKCNSDSYLNADQTACIQCPLQSSPNNGQTLCNCEGNNLFDISSNTCNAAACPEFSSVINNVCTCSNGLIMNNNMCKSCPLNSVADSSTFTSCLCDGNYIYFASSNSCEACPSNSVKSGNICECDGQSYQESISNSLPSCYLCPSSSSPDKQAKTCVCSGNSFYTPSANSCSACLENSTVVNNVCTCDSDSYLVSQNANLTVCFKCPVFSTPDNVNFTCVCQSNQFYSPSNNTCTSCLQNSSIVNNNCVCDSDSYQVSNSSGLVSCFKCPPLSTPNQQQLTCVCPISAYYTQANNSCTLCPQNSLQTDNICVCQNSFMNLQNSACISDCSVENAYISFNNTACVQYCTPFYIALSDDKCVDKCVILNADKTRCVQKCKNSFLNVAGDQCVNDCFEEDGNSYLDGERCSIEKCVKKDGVEFEILD